MEDLINDREVDIQTICEKIVIMNIHSTGDSGSGGECPFCLADCGWDSGISEVKHELNCIYLIAKDLLTNSKH